MLYDIILTLNGVARQASRTPQKNPPEWEYSIVVYFFLFLAYQFCFLVSGHGWHGVYNRAGRVGTRSDLVWEVFWIFIYHVLVFFFFFFFFFFGLFEWLFFFILPLEVHSI